MAARDLRPSDAPHRRGGGASRHAGAGRADRPRRAAVAGVGRQAADDLRRCADRRGAIAKQAGKSPMIAKFLPYLKAHRWQVGLALAQVFVVAAFELLKPWPLQIVIDYVLGGKTAPADGALGSGPLHDLLSLSPTTVLLLACAAMVLVHLGTGLLTLWHNYTTIKVGQAMVNDLRGDLYAHLQRLSLAYHTRQRVGD